MDAYETPCEIIVLPALEGIRRRPAMYVGDTSDGTGMHYVLGQLIEHAIEAYRDGAATYVRVQVDGDTVIVEDDGPGLPIDPLPRQPELNALEAIFTRLTHWMNHGPALANALSAALEVEVWRGGRTYRLCCQRGYACGPVEDVGPATRTGTRIAFTPDFTLLRRLPWDREAIATRLRELAALTPHLALIGDSNAYRAPEGLADHARYLAGDATRLHRDPVHVRGAHAGIDVEVALVWTDRPGLHTLGFVNRRPVHLGSHVEGLSAGVRHGLERVAPERLRGVYPAAFREVIAPGLIGVVHVVREDPRFGYGKNARFEDPDVGVAVLEVVATGLADALTRTPALRERLLARMPPT